MIEWIKKRVAERSTWVGILALAGIFGVNISPELKEQILTAITALVAVIFTVTADSAKARETDGVKNILQAGSTGTDIDKTNRQPVDNP